MCAKDLIVHGKFYQPCGIVNWHQPHILSLVKVKQSKSSWVIPLGWNLIITVNTTQPIFSTWGGQRPEIMHTFRTLLSHALHPHQGLGGQNGITFLFNGKFPQIIWINNFMFPCAFMWGNPPSTTLIWLSLTSMKFFLLYNPHNWHFNFFGQESK